MRLESDPAKDTDPVQSLLATGECTYCDETDLEYDSYKGNEAVVCVTCGTPVAQFWDRQ